MMANNPKVRDNLKPFAKGDVRINRKGRPKSLPKLRELFQSIGNEMACDKDGNPIIIDGHVATVIEMIGRSWTKDPKHQRDFIENGWGKVPNPIEVSGKDGEPVKIEVEYINSPIAAPGIPSEPTERP